MPLDIRGEITRGTPCLVAESSYNPKMFHRSCSNLRLISLVVQSHLSVDPFLRATSQDQPEVFVEILVVDCNYMQNQ